MVTRLGDVLYWAACILSVACLALAWLTYEGVDTTGIQQQRRQGVTDVQILKQRQASDADRFDYQGALRAGYSATEILDALIKKNKSRLGGVPDWNREPVLLLAGIVALLSWLIGRALRYVLAGK